MFLVETIQLISQLIFGVTLVATIVGLISFYILLLKDKNWKTILILMVFPPYIIKLILKMEESYTKKILSIFILGGFVLTLFFNIIAIVLTPPA